MIWNSLLSRFREMAGIYSENFICKFEGIAVGMAIPAEVTTKWKEQTDKVCAAQHC